MLWIISATIALLLLLVWFVRYIRKREQKRNDMHYCRTLFHYPRHGDEE